MSTIISARFRLPRADTEPTDPFISCANQENDKTQSMPIFQARKSDIEYNYFWPTSSRPNPLVHRLTTRDLSLPRVFIRPNGQQAIGCGDGAYQENAWGSLTKTKAHQNGVAVWQQESNPPSPQHPAAQPHPYTLSQHSTAPCHQQSSKQSGPRVPYRPQPKPPQNVLPLPKRCTTQCRTALLCGWRRYRREKERYLRLLVDGVAPVFVHGRPATLLGNLAVLCPL